MSLLIESSNCCLFWYLTLFLVVKLTIAGFESARRNCKPAMCFDQLKRLTAVWRNSPLVGVPTSIHLFARVPIWKKMVRFHSSQKEKTISILKTFNSQQTSIVRCSNHSNIIEHFKNLKQPVSRLLHNYQTIHHYVWNVIIINRWWIIIQQPLTCQYQLYIGITV